MDFEYPPETEAFRARVKAFLAANLPSGWRGLGALDAAESAAFTKEWRDTLYHNRFLALSWPVEYGGAGLSPIEQVVLAEEFAWAGVPTGSHSDLFGIKMFGTTLLRWGTEEQRHRFLPRVLSGADVWCQGYSEPDAGSDLASLRTSAALDGGEWVVNGQKVWTSAARLANWMFLLARTDPSVPPHRGITMLLLPLGQHGIDVRPITMMSGAAEFNTVYFQDARTAAGNVVGEVNGGWPVATSLLALERGEEAATNPVLFRAELDRLIELAAEHDRLHDPLVRGQLAHAYIKTQIMRYLGWRVLTSVIGGQPLGPEASISKLFWSEYHQEVTALALGILGPAATVPTGRPPQRVYRTDDPGAPNSSASWVGAMYNAIAGTIYAGTSEIQRNIIAERVLGLPRH